MNTAVSRERRLTECQQAITDAIGTGAVNIAESVKIVAAQFSEDEIGTVLQDAVTYAMWDSRFAESVTQWAVVGEFEPGGQGMLYHPGNLTAHHAHLSQFVQAWLRFRSGDTQKGNATMTKRQFMQTAAKHSSVSGAVSQIIVSVTIKREDIPDDFDALVSALDADNGLAAEVIGINFENACAQAGVKPSDIADCDPAEYEVTCRDDDPEAEQIEIWRCCDL